MPRSTISTSKAPLPALPLSFANKGLYDGLPGPRLRGPALFGGPTQPLPSFRCAYSRTPARVFIILLLPSLPRVPAASVPRQINCAASLLGWLWENFGAAPVPVPSLSILCLLSPTSPKPLFLASRRPRPRPPRRAGEPWSGGPPSASPPPRCVPRPPTSHSLSLSHPHRAAAAAVVRTVQRVFPARFGLGSWCWGSRESYHD
jgi:hypothetical protein